MSVTMETDAENVKENQNKIAIVNAGPKFVGSRSAE